MNICFLARPSFDWFSVEILKNLRERYDENLGGFFVTSDSKETKFINDNIDNKTICETSSFLRTHWNELTLEKLIELEKEYDCAPIWKYIYTDRFLVKRDYEYAIKITVGLFLFFENIFSNNKIDFYYSETIATLQCYIAYIVGKKYGVKYVAQMSARGNLDSLFHYFVDDEYQHNASLRQDYLNIEYTDEEMTIAENYLREFESKDSPPPAMQMVDTKPKFKASFLFLPIKYFIKKHNKYLNDPCSYMYYKAYEDKFNSVIYYFNYLRAKKYFQKPDYNKKYVYFPLHYQPEASTCVCAQKYEKQLFYIDNWAKSLPADTILYVKEHYALLGHRGMGFYKELKNYPNVFLIDPWESSRKLIENAEAVTTLTGTAGIEGFLLRKPVIICGNAVYQNAPGVIKLEDIYDNYLPSINAWKRPSRIEVIKYLCACFRSYSKGNAYAQNFHELLDKNIDLLCDSLWKYVNDKK